DHGQFDLGVLEVVLRLGDVGFSDFDFVGRGTCYLHFEFGAGFRKLRLRFFKSGARIDVRKLRDGLSFADVVAFVHVDFVDHAIHGRAPSSCCGTGSSGGLSASVSVAGVSPFAGAGGSSRVATVYEVSIAPLPKDPATPNDPVACSLRRCRAYTI